MRRFLASLMGVLLVAGAASACLNDSELPGHEREFRSSYKRQSPADTPSESNYLPAATAPALLGAGGLLLAGGLVYVLRPLAKS
ncbi:MAG: hypothetical protein ACJ8F7_04750 [Gemmataceae bacterium]